MVTGAGKTGPIKRGLVGVDDPELVKLTELSWVVLPPKMLVPSGRLVELPTKKLVRSRKKAFVDARTKRLVETGTMISTFRGCRRTFWLKVVSVVPTTRRDQIKNGNVLIFFEDGLLAEQLQRSAETALLNWGQFPSANA